MKTRKKWLSNELKGLILTYTHRQKGRQILESKKALFYIFDFAGLFHENSENPP